MTHLQGSEWACPADDDEPAHEPIIEPADEPVDEFGDEHVEERVDFQEEEQPEQNLHATAIMLKRVHANLGHPSRGLMLRLLRDANAPPEMLTVARDVHCPHCDLMSRRTGAVRPVQVSRGKEIGHISIQLCHWKRNRDGREAIIVNIIDEASRFNVAVVLKEGDDLGNLTAMDYIEAVWMNWFRFARHQLSFAWILKVLSNLMSFESGVQLEASKLKWRQVRHIGK